MIAYLYSTLMRPHLEFCVQICVPQYRKNMELLKQVWRKATKITGRLEQLSRGERLREMGFFNLDKERLWGDLLLASQHLKIIHSMIGIVTFV